MLIDLHNHTAPLSWDSSLHPDDLIQLAKKAGLDGICMTEHDQFWPPDELRALGRRHDFLVLPGVEINTEDGHVLVFGIDRYIFGMHCAPFLRAYTEEAGGVLVAAHPYRRNFRHEEGPWVAPYEEQLLKAGDNNVLLASAAVETLNGRGSPWQNRFSDDLCRRHGRAACGASDAHQARDVAACATEFSSPIHDVADLIAELRAGRCRPVDLRVRD